MIWGPRRSTRTKTLFSYTTIFRSPPAILAWADGTIFRGVSIGAPGHTVAEVVFNTAMTGYQEILTDPSYNGQIVTLTYPHIGNTGVNTEDVETARVLASGLVVRDCPSRVSNFRATQRSDERRGGTEGVRTGGIRWWP